VEVGGVAAAGGAELLAPDAVVPDIDDAVVVDVPEQRGAQAGAPGARWDGGLGGRRRRGRLTRPPGGVAEREQRGQQAQQRDEGPPPALTSRHAPLPADRNAPPPRRPKRCAAENVTVGFLRVAAARPLAPGGRGAGQRVARPPAPYG